MKNLRWLKQQENILAVWKPIEQADIDRRAALATEVEQGYTERRLSVISAIEVRPNGLREDNALYAFCSGCGCGAAIVKGAVGMIPHTKKCSVAGRYLESDLAGYSDEHVKSLRAALP